VALEPGDPPQYQVAGALCWRGHLAGRSVLVLVHGITHSHLNWDLRYQPERYSYVDAFTRAGYATFNVDRIGTGTSDRAPAAEVTLESNAFVLHQIVAGLRSGTVGGTAFPRVALVGHSYGTAVSEAEAGRYRDVDAVVALSALHSVDPGALSIVFANHVPAQTDSRFRNAGLPLGYLTTREGVRGELFYEPTNSDPKVVALDEATKQTDTNGEWGTLAQFVSPPAAQTVEVPVFIAVGDRDRLACNTYLSCVDGAELVRRERFFFAADACLEGWVQRGAGHNVLNERSAPAMQAAVLDFVDRHVGPQGIPTGSGGC
jgi:pimeloyl-ACP methyl ester carboxylesterase